MHSAILLSSPRLQYIFVCKSVSKLNYIRFCVRFQAFHVGTQLLRPLPQSSSKENLFDIVRARMGKSSEYGWGGCLSIVGPSTVGEVVGPSTVL